MKKTILAFCFALLLVGCSNIVITDNDDFRLFAYGEFISNTNICVQSHDGFVVDERYHTEGIFEKPVTVENWLDGGVILKITDNTGSRFVELGGHQTITFERPPEPDEEK